MKKIVFFTFLLIFAMPILSVARELRKESAEQVASFSDKINALEFARKAREKGIEVAIKKNRVKGRTYYRILAVKEQHKKLLSLDPGLLKKERPPKFSAHAEETRFQRGPRRDSVKGGAEPAKAQNPVFAEGGPPEIIPVGQGGSDSALDRESPDNAKVGGPLSEGGTGEDRNGALAETEVGKFETRQDAVDFIKRISERGYVTILRSDVSKEGKTIYRVFVVIRGNEKPSADVASKPERAGTVKTGNLFEQSGRNLHAGASVSGTYTDNAFNTKDDRKSGYVVSISPEMWLLFPGYYEKPLSIEESSERSPGGLLLSRVKPEVSRRYYGFFSYKAEIPLFWKNFPPENTVTHDAKARFISNFGGTLSLDMIDQFSRSYETRATNVAVAPTEVDKYTSNLFNAIMYYDAARRFRLRLEYSNFLVSFDDPANDFRDRMDNYLSAYLYYRLMPKTSVFAQYSFTTIGYKTNRSLDSREDMFAAGLQWDFTAKSTGIIKAGYQIKDFPNSSASSGNYVFELQAKHRFNSKNFLSFTAFRRTDETDISSAGFILTEGARTDFQHLFSQKLTGFLDFQYTRDRYDDIAAQSGFSRIQDDTYEASATLQYAFRRWLKSDLVYTFMKRDSNIPSFTFTSNMVTLRITAVL